MEQHAHNNLLFKFSILLLIAAGIFGYYWYQSTQAGTTINTTISTNDDLENGLIGHWTFDGPNMAWGSTTAEALDLSSSSLEGDVTNMDMTAVTTGKIGQALQFDGVNDRVDMGDVNAFDSLTAGSGCAWVKPRTITSDDTIFSKWTPSPDYDGLFFFRDDVSQSGRADTFTILLDQTGASTTRLDSAAQASKLNTWAHVCYTFTLNTAGGLRLYVNGIEDPNSPRSTAGLTSIDANAAFQIGNTTSDAGLRESDMIIDDVRVYNRALTAREIKRLYEMGATTHINTTVTSNDDLENGLVGHWTFDGPKMNWGSTTAEVIDSSASGVSGNATNMNQSAATAGKIGQALSFSKLSTSSVITDGRPGPLDDLPAITVSSWIKMNSISSPGSPIVAKSDSTYYGWKFHIQEGASDPKNLWFSVTYDYGNRVERESQNNAIRIGQWQHVVATWDGTATGTNIHLYIDGIETTYKTTSNASGARTSDCCQGSGYSSLALGSEYRSASFDGVIDDTRVYNRVLSASEVKRLYELGATTHINTTIDTNDDLENGLVGHWTFDGPKMAWASTTAEVLDSSVSSIEGNMVNMDTSAATAGKIGQALRFDGLNDYISATNTMNGNHVTYGGWFKHRCNSGIPCYPISQVNALDEGFYTPISNGRLYCTDGAVNGSGVPITVNTWTHYMCRHDGSNITTWVNGEQRDTVASVASATQGFLVIGAYWSPPSNHYFGEIDDVRIYNRVLSAAEIKRLYELGGGR